MLASILRPRRLFASRMLGRCWPRFQRLCRSVERLLVSPCRAFEGLLDDTFFVGDLPGMTRHRIRSSFSISLRAVWNSSPILSFIAFNWSGRLRVILPRESVFSTIIVSWVVIFLVSIIVL